MYFILYILGLVITGQLVKSERGECTEFPPTQDQNLLFDKSLQINPCGSKTKAVKCLTSDGCTLLSLDPANCPYSISLNQDTIADLVVLKVEVSVPPSSEFFIEAYPTNDEGEILSDSFILGSFEDVLYKNCSSYACCNPRDSTIRDVARKCPMSLKVSMSESTPYSFLWSPPTNYVGFIVFVGYFFKSNSEHWEQVTSDILQLGNPTDNTGEEETKIATQTIPKDSLTPPSSVSTLSNSALPVIPVPVKSNQPVDSSGFSIPEKIVENKATVKQLRGMSRNVAFSGEESDDSKTKKVTRRNKLMMTESNMTGVEVAGIRVDVTDVL